MKPASSCSTFNFDQDDVLFWHLGQIFMVDSIPEGNDSPSPEKIDRGPESNSATSTRAYHLWVYGQWSLVIPPQNNSKVSIECLRYLNKNQNKETTHQRWFGNFPSRPKSSSRARRLPLPTHNAVATVVVVVLAPSGTALAPSVSQRLQVVPEAAAKVAAASSSCSCIG